MTVDILKDKANSSFRLLGEFGFFPLECTYLPFKVNRGTNVRNVSEVRNAFEIKLSLPQISDSNFFVVVASFLSPPVTSFSSASLMSRKFSFFVLSCFLHVSVVLLFPFSLILVSLPALLVSITRIQRSQRSVMLDLYM